MSSGQTFLLSSSLAYLVALAQLQCVSQKYTTQHPCTEFITHSPPACPLCLHCSEQHYYSSACSDGKVVDQPQISFSHLTELIRTGSSPPSVAGSHPHDFIYCRFHNPVHLFLPRFSQETLTYFFYHKFCPSIDSLHIR